MRRDLLHPRLKEPTATALHGNDSCRLLAVAVAFSMGQEDSPYPLGAGRRPRKLNWGLARWQ